ncbi:hypothetical protein BXZ70DRAFT_985047 [Cristinia sonorae]|uniref:Uncharacterized protein n=1 Tax=Cristinia sonorae TaxID=1940300 RepID=A0A8K0XSJ6_9AGAR|nr:hypothetical protein BXZ70DRAFT_985047 [Cristinia sonorae]
MPSRRIESVLSPHYNAVKNGSIHSLPGTPVNTSRRRLRLRAQGVVGSPSCLLQQKLHTSQCIVPVEVVEEIVVAILAEQPTFSSIANLSLASYQFRQIAFRNFFKNFNALSKRAWCLLTGISGVYSWARSIQSLSTTIFHNIETLQHFQNIHTVNVDMSPEGLNTQRTFIKYLLAHLPSRLLHLKLCFLPRIDTNLLSGIAERFPALKTLALTCTERLIDDCCWDCYEETSTCTLHSPIPDVYFDAEDLSCAFGSALSPLTKLEHLTLGIFLSHLDTLHYHLRHCRSTATTPAILQVYGPGSCTYCRLAFESGTWNGELFASASVSRFLPALKSVSWSSYFVGDQPGDGLDGLTTTAWVRREEGKVSVRRAPW